MSHTKVEKKLIYKKGDGYFCYKCEGQASYNERHDAYFCKPCDEWLEGACNSDCDCYDYFGGRPEKPSEI